MGCFYEINDTLLLTREQGFPVNILNVDQHQKKPITHKDVANKIFSFKNKSGARAFQLDPVRVHLVEKTANGKWLFWGKAYIQSLSISRTAQAPVNSAKSPAAFNPDDWTTSGTFKIVQLFDPEFQQLFTSSEAPAAANYFAPSEPVKDQINYHSTFTLNKGTKVAAFKKLANQLKKLAAKEPGTLHYNFFATKNDRIFTFLESYANSKAAIIHGENNKDVVAAMVEISTVDLEVFGNASKALKKSLQAAKPTYYHWEGGIPR